MDVPRNGTAGVKLQDPLVLVIAICVLASIGIIANFIVIFVFVYNKTYKKSLSFKLLLHQAVIDMAGSLMFLIVCNIDFPDGAGESIACKMESLLIYMSITSTYNFVTLTVERYIAVVHPMIYRQRCLGGKMKYLSVTIPYVCSVLLTVPYTIYTDMDANTTVCTVEEIHAVAGELIIIADWLIPFSLMLYCYVRILLQLHKIRVVSQQSSSEVPTSNERRVISIKKDLILTLILMALIYTVTITPYSVHSIFIINRSYSHTLHLIVILLLILNLCINPFIYSMVIKDFQRGLRKIRDNIFQG